VNELWREETEEGDEVRRWQEGVGKLGLQVRSTWGVSYSEEGNGCGCPIAQVADVGKLDELPYMLTEIKFKKEGGVGFGCRWAWRRWVGFREKEMARQRILQSYRN
jgi:hypothetical protein